MPVSSGVKNDTMAFHTVVTAVWIAVSTVEMAVWIACQMVSNRYWNASNKGFMVL